MRPAIPGLWWFHSERGGRMHAREGKPMPNVYNHTLCRRSLIPSGEPDKDSGLPGMDGCDCLACVEAIRKRWPQSTPEAT